MKRVLQFALLISVLVGLATAQQTFNPPTVYSGNATTGLIVTAGTVNVGGHPVTVAAVALGTLTVALNKTSCASPTFASCNFVYADNTGVVAVTAVATTAFASQNTILAYIETGASTITQIVYGWQSQTPFSNIGAMSSSAGAVTSYSCATTSTCAATLLPQLKLVTGTVALASASPSTVTVTALPFTTTAFTCTASPAGNTAAIAAGGIAITYSTNTVIFTGPNTVTTVIDYICVGV